MRESSIDSGRTEVLGVERGRLENLGTKIRYGAGDKIFKLFMYVLLFGISFVFLYPFLYMIVTSLKSYRDLNDFTVNWIPRELKFENYVIAYRALDYGKYIKNSITLTVIGTAGHILSCSFIGYGFARYEFRGKKMLFFAVILSIIVPVQTLIVPLYMTFSNLKWLNTYLPVLVPTFFGFGLRGGLFIFIFRQFYLGLPKELEDAAKIDGCNFLRTYWNIALPVARSAFLVVLVLSVVWHWNDFYEPAIYANKPNMRTLPMQLDAFNSMVNRPPDELFEEMMLDEGEQVINNAVLMAGTFLAILPILTMFSFVQRKFMQGIERTGLGGD